MHLNTFPTLWTAKQAAAECECSVSEMAQEMSNWFEFLKIRDLRCNLYCVDSQARFCGNLITSLDNKTLIALWRDQHKAAQELPKASSRVEALERINSRL